MKIRKRAAHAWENLFGPSLRKVGAHPFTSRQFVLQGSGVAKQVRSFDKLISLADVEFSVFSQWGEDGIIEWLVHMLRGIPESFVEFGVENYREANTRFLLCHRNWRGLVIDGSAANIDTIRRDDIYWRHDLTAVAAFITAENIGALIADAGFVDEIGILSVDIDGNDYWVWQAIDKVSPWLVIAEYNAVFGDINELTIPYDPAFVRTKAHYSNLYYGASIGALVRLAKDKGYKLLGSNRAGSNAFFVRDDLAPRVIDRIADLSPRPSRFREARDAKGGLMLRRAHARADEIGRCEVVDVASGRRGPLGSFGQLYSERWIAEMG